MPSVNNLDLILEQLDYSSASGLARDDLSPMSDAMSRSWQELREKTGVEAAYFHGRTPLITFAHSSNSAETHDIRRRLWNLSKVPLLIISSESEITAYSCLVTPQGPLREDRAEVGRSRIDDDLRSTLAEFSRFQLEAGAPMSLHPQEFNRSQRVDVHLLDNLRQLRRSLLEGKTDHEDSVNALIGRSIFIRYFEDRAILTHDHFQELSGVSNFDEALTSGTKQTFRLFEALSQRFNGDLFQVGAAEKKQIKGKDLQLLSMFFSGTHIDSGQQSFWPYDFSIIPPEMISAIYEQLLEDRQSSDAAYYTPRAVVDLILDQVLPWEGSSSATRILDPSCGSGIFLTESFRRLLHRMYGASRSSPSFEELVDLLKSSIFGIDINAQALKVTALGLYLALLEQLDPPSAWQSAHFPRLEDTILIHSDFFEHEFGELRFDLIVGNPPWMSRLTPAASAYVNTQRLPVGDKQIAMAFVRRAESLLDNDGRIAFLLPAKGLLHNRSKSAVRARLDLFQRLEVETIIDLTSLRIELFSSSIAPAAVMIAALRSVLPEPNDSSQPGDVLHVAPRLSPLQRAIDGFLVSSDDVSFIRAEVAQSVPDVWKTYLRGTYRDFSLIEKMRLRFPTLESVAFERKWVVGCGFQDQVVGGDENPSSHLLGLPIIEYDRIRNFGITGQDSQFIPEELPVITANVMHRPRNPQLFKAPHVLVRRTVAGDIPAAALLMEDAGFKNVVVGIASPSEEDSNVLALVEAYINSSLFHYYQFLTCSTWGVERSVIEKNEILGMPFSMPSRRLSDQILNVSSQIRESQFRFSELLPELDQLVFKAFGLGVEDADQVIDAVAQFHDDEYASASLNVDKSIGRNYIFALRASLRTFIEDAEVELTEIVGFSHYRVAAVRLARESESSDWEAERFFTALTSEYDEAVIQSPSAVTLIQPSMMILNDNSTYIVKPDERRYWTKSRARADAAEIIGAVIADAGRNK
jgi:hypothetical protein